MIRVSWRQLLPLVAASVVLLQLPLTTPNNTYSIFSGSRGSSVHQLKGAEFVPNVAPVVTAVKAGINTKLSWSEVVSTSGATVTYLVQRISSGGVAVNICDSPGAITVSRGVVSCTEKNVPASSTFTEQPVVVVNGSVTWSLPPSTPA